MEHRYLYNVSTSLFESLQQKVSMYTKWFHSILSEFNSCNEQGPMKK